MKIFLIFIIFLAFPFDISAQKSKKSNLDNKFNTDNEIQLDTKKLPPLYFGNNPLKLFVSISKIPDKGEFESTDVYKARLAKAINPKRIYAIVPYKDDACKFDYDADASEWDISCPGSDVEISSSEQFLGTRIGSNAFGVKRRIKYYKDLSMEISNRNMLFNRLKIAIAQPPEIAKLYKGKMHPLYIFNVICDDENPLSISNKTYGATIDDPVEIYESKMTLRVDILAVWIYHIGTGEILWKSPE